MANINIILNQEEILYLLSTNKEDAFKKLFQETLNAFILAESDEQLGASRYERSDNRTDSRNGFRDRVLKTRIGEIELHVPRHRNQPFHTMLFENYSRSEQALITTMAEMVVNGISTRKVTKVMETLCDTTFSKSTVSEACKTLDRNVNSFKQRKLENSYPFVILDATYFKVRENNRIVSKAMMVAVGTRYDGHREVLGFDIYKNESIDTWKSFLETLKARGMNDVKMFISDSHTGILHAISEHYPNSPWQRCQTHFSRNILAKTPSKYQKGLAAELSEMYNCRTIEQARKKRDEIINDYSDVAEKAMECLDNGFDSVMTVMTLPETYRRYYRTSNHIERLNRELKRRSTVIGVFPNVDSLNRLIGSVILEENDKYQIRRSSSIPLSINEDMNKCSSELIILAEEQHLLLAA